MSLTREQLLSKPTNPFQPKAGSTATDILERMADTAFQGRQLGQAFKTWRDMLADPECTILMGMSGAMTPAGMRRLVRFMIENRLIDVLTSTGANFFHDIHETQGFFHYQGSPSLNDEMLGENLVDRVYDVLADEEQFREHDRWVGRFAGGLEQRAYTTREFLYLLGKDLGTREGPRHRLDRGQGELSAFLSRHRRQLDRHRPRARPLPR
ncbi:MAG: deoxyhypusine synthase family protein [Bryobacterales bacterium]